MQTTVTTVTTALKGHQFAVTLTGNGDEAAASFYRDGALLGQGWWDGEGFVFGVPYLLPDIDDSEDVLRALRCAVWDSGFRPVDGAPMTTLSYEVEAGPDTRGVAGESSGGVWCRSSRVGTSGDRR